MSIPLIAIVTFIYCGVALSESYAGHHGMAFCFAGYAMANIGLMWAMLG